MSLFSSRFEWKCQNILGRGVHASTRATLWQTPKTRPENILHQETLIKKIKTKMKLKRPKNGFSPLDLVYKDILLSKKTPQLCLLMKCTICTLEGKVATNKKAFKRHTYPRLPEIWFCFIFPESLGWICSEKKQATIEWIKDTVEHRYPFLSI